MFIGEITIDVPELSLLLAVGVDIKKVERYVKNNDYSKHNQNEIIDSFRKLIPEDVDGFYNSTSKHYRYLYLKKYKGTREDIKTLYHELSHLIDDESEWRCFTKETEFKAYLQQALFTKIDKTLIKGK